ncbi:hypothetical protein [Planktothrix pseudagardhii]|nr:hypothetical protein [Planktothrix pseudagardhii]
MTHPQIRNLERVATVLASVPERFVFTGGATGSGVNFFASF